MTCEEGREIEGFYDQFTVILGMLDHFESHRGALAGVRVDFGDRGLYYDPAFGSNSWAYHFQPIDVCLAADPVEQKMSTSLEDRFSARGELMPRARAHALIERYIHPRPRIRRKVDAFERAHFRGHHVIGVHYRGTDMWREAPRVPYEGVRAAVRRAIRASGTGRWRIFAASDEQAFVDYMSEAFPGRVRSWSTRRSTERDPYASEPIDFRTTDNFRKGEDAVIDCLLLSRCRQFVRTVSNLGLCAGFFNPDAPEVVLNRHYREIGADLRD